MSSNQTDTVQGTRLWVRILLAVSLALNLMIVGAIVGFLVKGGPWKHAGPPGQVADSAVGPLTRALNHTDKIAIARQVRKEGREKGWSRKVHREALERMLVLLETTPFDADAFAQEFNGTIEGLQGMLSGASAAYVIRLAEMSDEDRAAYAERVKEELGKRAR